MHTCVGCTQLGFVKKELLHLVASIGYITLIIRLSTNCIYYLFILQINSTLKSVPLFPISESFNFSLGIVPFKILHAFTTQSFIVCTGSGPNCLSNLWYFRRISWYHPFSPCSVVNLDFCLAFGSWSYNILNCCISCVFRSDVGGGLCSSSPLICPSDWNQKGVLQMSPNVSPSIEQNGHARKLLPEPGKWRTFPIAGKEKA